MGRTYRTRRRKNLPDKQPNLSNDCDLINFMKWMVKNGWKQSHKFQVSMFLTTGRGILTKENIKAGENIIKIPDRLLITLKTVSESVAFVKFLDTSKRFSTQQLLAAFLVFEKHLMEDSFWFHYIKSLPKTFPIPAFYNFVNNVPCFLSEEISKMCSKIEEQLNHFLSCMGQIAICNHCGKNAKSIFDFESFKWAWCVVNSRAVYIAPDCGGPSKFSLNDSNCLALAPYLDLFNHSNDARVKACVNSDGSYEITTLTPFKKYCEVFINYGQHSNLNLFLQYGFILKSNVNDTIPLTFPSILQSTKKIYPNVLNSVRTYCDYIKSHELLKDPSLNADGLSWSASVIIFILISSNRLDLKSIEFKVYSDDFDANDRMLIKEIALILIQDKQIELKSFVHQLEGNPDLSVKNGDELSCHKIAIELIREYENILENCSTALS